MTSATALPDAPDECSASLRSKIAWGVATSAYQVEGAVDADGRSACIWDTFAAQPGRVAGNATADIAADHYHRFEEDVRLMVALGVRHYRLSLSWSRILPGGGRGTQPNAAGIKFYRRLLQELHAARITPVVTLCHGDLPQILQDSYGGFLDGQLAEDFLYYADVVFSSLGSLVQHWLTFSDPMAICGLGYGLGAGAPGMSHGAAGQYACGHTLLLAHGRAVQLYRLKYAGAQAGRVSIALSAHWGLPADQSSAADVNASALYMEFQLGWLADPLQRGDYPASMRASQPKLPRFSEQQRRLLAGSTDFLALSYFTTHFVRAPPPGSPPEQMYEEALTDAEGRTPGGRTATFWQYSAPDGLRQLLAWVASRYQRPEVWVVENGVALAGESALAPASALLDAGRISFLSEHLGALCSAVLQDGANVAAYFVWGLLDAFEWSDGYAPRFGLVHVDRTSPALKRTPKLSSHWMSRHFFRHAPDNIACLEIRSCQPSRPSSLLPVR